MACQPGVGSLPDSDDQASRNSSLGRTIFLRPVEEIDFVFHADRVVAGGERNCKRHDGLAPPRDDEPFRRLIFVEVGSERVEKKQSAVHVSAELSTRFADALAAGEVWGLVPAARRI